MILQTSSKSIILETRNFLSKQIDRVELTSERDELRQVMRLLGDIAEEMNKRDVTIEQYWLNFVKQLNTEIEKEKENLF